jgi:predicted metal-dependent HD superfamily phosphohydrolase
MARVQGPSIEADIGAETARLDVPLRTIVAVLAQALKRAKPELIDIAVMWLDVIADCRRLDNAALRAILTQRMLEQLVLPDPGPTSRGVPLIPLRRLATSAHRTQPFIWRV